MRRWNIGATHASASPGCVGIECSIKENNCRQDQMSYLLAKIVCHILSCLLVWVSVIRRWDGDGELELGQAADGCIQLPLNMWQVVHFICAKTDEIWLLGTWECYATRAAAFLSSCVLHVRICVLCVCLGGYWCILALVLYVSTCVLTPPLGMDMCTNNLSFPNKVWISL